MWKQGIVGWLVRYELFLLEIEFSFFWEDNEVARRLFTLDKSREKKD